MSRRPRDFHLPNCPGCGVQLRPALTLHEPGCDYIYSMDFPPRPMPWWLRLLGWVGL